MSRRRRPRRPPPPPFDMLKSDMDRLGAELKRRGLRHQIGRAWTGLEAFYLSDEKRARLAAMPWAPRWLFRSWWLLVSLLSKLTPVRRVLLAFALLIIVSNLPRGQFAAFGADVRLPLPGGFFGPVLLLVVLMLELKDKLVARDELEAGRRVQLALMPEPSPHVPGWDVWLYTEPANDVGGDLVDHQQIDDRRHAVVLGDVAGKALPAALLMVKLQATLRALAPQFHDLGDLGSAVNEILVRDGLPNRFATLVFLVLTDDAAISVLNAGHMPPLVVRANEIEPMAAGAMALGMFADAEFQEQHVAVRDGDVLVVYSDGVTEAMNESNEFFGDDRLRAAIAEGLGQSVQAIGTRITKALATFVGEGPRHDDVSLVVLKRREPPSGQAGPPP